MDDILNLVIFAVIFLLAAAFKKKKPGGTGTRPAQPRAVRPQPRAATGTRPSPALEQAAAGRAWGEPQRGAGMQEIFELLRAQYVEEGEETGGDGEGGEVTEPEAPSSSWSQGLSETPESLETPEPAGGASHERFHERYIDDTLSRPATVRARYSFHREPISMRQAIVWREILGPPKGLE